MRPESTAVRWGAYAGAITFLLLIPFAIASSDQVVWGTIGILAVASSIVVTLVGRWWERGWNIKIANAEERKVDIEERRLSIEEKKLSIEERRLSIEFMSAIASLSSLISLLPEDKRVEAVEMLLKLALDRFREANKG